MVQALPRTNPFPGLRPFELDEEHLFFGREGQADQLLERLAETRFLAMVGSSGSGKSSLVRAGLLPSLYSGFLTEAGSRWRVAILRPGSAPMGNLAAALNAPEVLGVDTRDDEATIRAALMESTLRRGALGLVEVTRQGRLEADENLLVVVDQFEELFRFKQRAERASADNEAAAFVKLLLAAVQQRQVPVYVVLTMRSDFLGDCAQFRDLPEALNESQYLIPRLTRDQLAQAIEGPVAVGGATITPRLVNRLLNDTGDSPDQLPILQHALMRTWDYWEDAHEPGEPIDLEHYLATGGMAEALSRHADQIYGGLPDERARDIAEVLFKCLTDRGADNREIRRPTALAALCAVAAASPEDVIAVIEEFRGPRRSFLMPPRGVPLAESTVVDISHESLMRNWGQLRGWVEEEAQSATIYRRLAETAALHGQGRAGYLRDPELTIALTWRQEQQPNAAWGQRYAANFDEAMAFLDASAAAQAEEAEEQERRRRREVNRLRSFLVLLGGLSLLAGGAAVYALGQQGIAEKQTQLALRSAEEATAQRQIAEEQRATAEEAETEAERQRNIAVERAAEAEAAEADAQTQQAAAEQAQAAEAEQRQQAVRALQRAEEGEAEARRQTQRAEEQTEVAQRQTGIAEREKQISEHRSANSEVLAQSLVAQDLLRSNLALEGLLNALETGQSVWQQGDAIDSDKRMRATAVLLEAVYSIREKNRYEGHTNGINSVAFAPDGQTLASAGNDGTVKLWSRNGEVLRTLEGHTSGVNSVAFAPDGQTLASASTDGTVKLWSRNGEPLATLEGYIGRVYSVAFAPDGQTLAFAGDDDTAKLWSRNGEVLRTLEGHTSRISSVAFAPNGQTLASASFDGTVKLWNRNGEVLHTLEGHTGVVLNMTFAPDGQTLASASFDGTVKLWSANGEPLATFEGHTGFVNSVAFAPDGQTVISASTDGTIKLWSVNGEALHTLKDNTSWVHSIAFAPDGQILASAGTNGIVKLWSRNGELLHTLENHNGGVHSVAFAPDGQILASASFDGTVKLWSANGEPLATLEGHNSWVNSVAFAPDGQTLASASFDSTVRLWNVNGEPLATLKGHTGAVQSVAFAPDGQTLASASNDGTVKLWSVNGEPLATLKGHTGAVQSVAFAPDGQTLASASFDSTVRLWNVNGELLTTLKGHTGGIYSVAFAPDGQTLASASSDNNVKLWSRNGEPIATLKGHTSEVLSVTFAPDGQTLASAGFDLTIILWNLNLNDLIAKGCTWLGDYMANPATPAEERAVCEGVEVSGWERVWGRVVGVWEELRASS